MRCIRTCWELTNKMNNFESFESEIISIISVLITFCCIRMIVSVIILISSWNNFVENYIHILQTRLFNTRFDFFLQDIWEILRILIHWAREKKKKIIPFQEYPSTMKETWNDNARLKEFKIKLTRK